MVFVCSTDGKRQVIPLNPPAECKPGDRVVVKGYEHETAGGKVVENKRVAYNQAGFQKIAFPGLIRNT